MAIVTREALVLDMDGVLYHGDRPAPGLVDFFRGLRLPYVCVTNNSLVDAAQAAATLARMGVEVPVARVLTVADALAAYLRRTMAPGSPVLVIGEAPVRAAVAAAGLREDVHDPLAVVVGMDRSLGFEQLATACRALRRGGRLVACSLDPVLLTDDGVVPATGATVALLRACVDVEPEVVGKPRAALFEVAAGRLGVPVDRLTVVGDSLVSDVAGARAVGAEAVLLLSGVTVADAPRDLVPDLVLPDLSALGAHLAGEATS